MPYATYAGHENGSKAGFRNDDAQVYARRFKVDLTWLLTGRGAMEPKGKAPIVGYCGAGAEILPIDDHAMGSGFDDINLALPDDSVAVVIRGDSQHPLRDGWLILYTRAQDGVPDYCINQLCIVQVHEGPTLLKTVRRGSKPKLWNLESWNAPLRENVRLNWAAPVLAIHPR